jgi:molybdenum cofactor guanylyltransferase
LTDLNRGEVSAVVLAGGLSRRLGQDKASALLGGVPLLQHVLDRLEGLAADVSVVCRPGQDLPSLGGKEVTVVFDRYTGAGPLGGLYTGLETARHERVIAVGCDTPFVSAALLRHLLERVSGHDAAVPFVSSRPQPLCAVYAKAILGAVRTRIEAEKLRLTDILDDLDAYFMPEDEWRTLDPDGLSFMNLNTAADFEQASKLLASQTRG